MIRVRLAELTINLRDLPRLLPIACRGAIAALVQDSLGAATPGSAALAPAIRSERRTSTAEGERAHPGSAGHGGANAEVPPRGVPATAAAQIDRWREALQEIATRSGCTGGHEPGRCLDTVARKWWCPSCIAADALTDREAGWP